ncbi:MAG TPA: DedA family protein [Chthoniobacterales bacterium]|nr:DedA family protein [Chthoniobacterales bacterium]
MQHLLQIWFDWVLHGGYLGIIVLMALESSIFPVPSEIVIPPAAFLAGQGKLNIWGVIVAGTFGSWLGASITYWVSLWLGRIVIVKWGRFFAVSEAKLVRAENWLHRYEAGGIFFARLLPVIRHLISIPAGIIRMNFMTFSIMTVVGSAIWCAVLAWFGQTAITPEMLRDPAGLAIALKAKSHVIAAGVVVLCVLYFVAMRLTARPSEKNAL